MRVCNFRRNASVDYPDGRRLGQIVRPLDSMGAYTPAGRYPLPSTLLMNVLPAQVAGVKTTCVACPRPSPEIMGIAAWLGVTHFFQMGGAQAIAALAFGTETVPRVDRIVGPGNIYVAAAKKLVAGETGIRFRRRTDGDRDHRRRRQSPMDRGGYAGAGRARSGRIGGIADHVAEVSGGRSAGGRTSTSNAPDRLCRPAFYRSKTARL